MSLVECESLRSKVVLIERRLPFIQSRVHSRVHSIGTIGQFDRSRGFDRRVSDDKT